MVLLCLQNGIREVNRFRFHLLITVMLPQTYRQNIVSKFPRATLLQEGTHPLVEVMDTQDPAGWVES